MSKKIPTPSLLATHTKLATKATVLEGLAELTFPAQALNAPRPTLNLAIAIDASGSMGSFMAGASALDHAKAATLALIDRLDNNDRIAIVSYDGTPSVLLPSMSVGDARGQVKEILARLRVGGSTALHAGWLTAAQQAAPFTNDYSLSRVLLLSDGQATDGIRDEAQLAQEAEKLAAVGLTTSTYGLGMNFNERLMTGMAVGGVARYAETADTLIPYFESDFSMLAQTVAKSVHLSILAKDSKTGQSLSVGRLGGGGTDEAKWRLSAGVAGASSWAAFSVDVASHKTVELTAQWEVVDLKGQTQTFSEHLSVSRGKGAENKSVVARVSEAKAAAAAEAAADAARRGDIASTHAHLGILRTLSASSAYAGAVSDHLSALANAGDMSALVKETAYVGSTMRSRVVDTGERHDVLNNDRFGLRKAVQGKADPDTKSSNL